MSGDRVDDDHYCLAEVDLFRDLSRREMAALGARAPLRTVAAGQVVYTPLQPVSVLFIIKRGRIRLHHITPDGRSVTTAVLGPGTVFGEMDLLGLRMRGTWAEALSGCCWPSSPRRRPPQATPGCSRCSPPTRAAPPPSCSCSRSPPRPRVPR